MKLLQSTLLVLAGAWLLVFAVLALQQRALLYVPSGARTSPRDAGLVGVESVRLDTVDGETVEAWFRPPRSAQQPLIVYFHGNGGALVDRRDRYAALIAHGYGLLALSWRGYGGSSGRPSEAGLLRDAEAAYAEARRRGYGPARLVLMGESLGTGVATMIAARHPAAALVLDSPYDSILALAGWRFPYFPVGLALLDTFRADEAIGKVKAPVLMAVSEGDPITPATLARRLFARANEPRRLMVFPGAAHPALGSPGAFEQAIEWIDATLRASPARDPAQ